MQIGSETNENLWHSKTHVLPLMHPTNAYIKQYKKIYGTQKDWKQGPEEMFVHPCS